MWTLSPTEWKMGEFCECACVYVWRIYLLWCEVLVGAFTPIRIISSSTQKMPSRRRCYTLCYISCIICYSQHYSQAFYYFISVLYVRNMVVEGMVWKEVGRHKRRSESDREKRKHLTWERLTKAVPHRNEKWHTKGRRLFGTRTHTRSHNKLSKS